MCWKKHRLPARKICCADPRHGPVYLMKNDLSDAFFMVMLAASGIPKLGSVLPRLRPDDPHVIGFFHTGLPMGWTQSPPWLAVITETIADVANERNRHRWRPPKQRLDAAADTPAAGRCALRIGADRSRNRRRSIQESSTDGLST